MMLFEAFEMSLRRAQGPDLVGADRSSIREE
jgi:hypothetical protein